jgi:hypothetical protein
MKLQSNCQTKNGVWGVMLSGWEGEGSQKTCEFLHWMTNEEARALMVDLTDCVVGKPAVEDVQSKEDGDG